MVTPQTEVIARIEGEEIYREILPPGEYVIGRESDAQIRLRSDKVSRRHGQLTLNYFDWLIEDFHSANGTFVGGKPISEATLIFPRQEVRVGNVRFELRRVQISDAEESLAPQTAAVLRYLPTEMRGEQKYKIHGVIAMGGIGAVLEAEDLATRRRVAMKMVIEAKSADDIARFVEEAQVTAQLEHPNIIPVYELNANELDRPFYTMKLVRGESLASALTGLRLERPASLKRYPFSELLNVLQRVCNAMEYAHSKGVVHRDLKPDNILLGPYGETVVMDWGLAKPLGQSANSSISGRSIRTMVTSIRQDDSALATEAGTALGTPQYMAPEQAMGRSHTVDALADVYALGGLLYSILTLQPPVSGTDAQDILDRVVAGRITPPAEAIRLNRPVHLPEGKLPQYLVNIAMKALSLNPAERFDSVHSLQEALNAGQSESNRSGRFGFDALFGGKSSKVSTA